MEAILNLEQDRLRRLVIIAFLGALLSLLLLNITLAYDFSGGYTSSKTVGVTEDSILTIGSSSSVALDVGMEGEEIPAPATTNGGDFARDLLRTTLLVIVASAIIISVIRTGNWMVAIIGLIAFVIIQALLATIL